VTLLAQALELEGPLPAGGPPGQLVQSCGICVRAQHMPGRRIFRVRGEPQQMAAAARAKPDTVNEGRLRPVPRLLKDHRGPFNILIRSVAQCEIGLIGLEQWLIIRSLLVEKHSAPGGAWATPAQRGSPAESGVSVLEEPSPPQRPSSPSGLLAQPLRPAGSVPSGTPGLQ
jgi:hypothetical protein